MEWVADARLGPVGVVYPLSRALRVEKEDRIAASLFGPFSGEPKPLPRRLRAFLEVEAIPAREIAVALSVAV